MDPIKRIPLIELQNFTMDVFRKVGVPESDAVICTEVLLAADLRGIESHGMSRLKMYIDRILDGRQKAVTQIDIRRETPGTALLDGNHGMGAVISSTAMRIAIEKAKKVGTGTVAVTNSTHFGIAGYYPLMAVQQDMIGLTVTNTRPSTAPTFGVQPLLGTNPIAFGAPTDEECPFLFDAATPIIQRGKVEILARKDIPLHAGYVIDDKGQPATDPHAILKGLNNDTNAFLPLGGAGEEFGGHKGYGLATMVEILSASLQNGYFLMDLIGFNPDGTKRPFGLGHFFQAISIEAFSDIADFKRTTGEVLRTLRNSRLAEGETRIYTAGEKEFTMEKINRAEGILVTPNLADELNGLAQTLGLSSYRF
jgi:LDH2 family malate/lactate/ureidoglycolate dehydrogenase